VAIEAPKSARAALVSDMLPRQDPSKATGWQHEGLMPIEVAFADLTHTGKVVDANYTPLSVGYIAAYATTQLPGQITPRLFKYPAVFAHYLKQSSARIACFSNYMWNERLQCEFAVRLKQRRPDVTTVFGGPNYPTEVPVQQRFLERHPEIDFYIDGEGESGFVALFNALADVGFDAAALKARQVMIPNVHYLVDGRFVRSGLSPRILDLDASLPSPYLMGLLDEFFDDKLHPLMQTSRGCPYACTFCHDGIDYMNKTRKFSVGRIREELNYIADRVKVPGLTLADLNWGMFPEDIETAKILAQLKRDRGWPQVIASATAKNQKKRIVEMAKILGDSIQLGASIQSTDAVVLGNIKRTNIGIATITEMAKESTRAETSTFSEVILCLPGDTKEKHFKSVFDMMDAGINDLRTYQFILLPGTEGASDLSRALYRYETRFRVLPRCIGTYAIYDEDVSIAELHEVCVANRTMPFEEYVACRDLNLSLAVFNNGNLFAEVFSLAETLRIKRSELMRRIHELATTAGGNIGSLYAEFRADESRNFWPNVEELEAFLAGKEGIAEYLSGHYGANQIYKYRSVAMFELLDEVTEIPIAAIRGEMADRGLLDPILEQYLEDLRRIIVGRKTRVTELDEEVNLQVRFDFVALDQRQYVADPREFYKPDGVPVSLSFTDAQRHTLGNYFSQYGTTLDGLSYFIHRNPAQMLYRKINAATVH
jgi:radical SAM superfamily enzyme YgiQ (UPF0313 family)